MADTVALEVQAGLATMRLARAHGNAINGQLADDLVAACRQIEKDPGIRGVMFTGAGRLFCPGLDLLELIELDRAAMGEFLERLSAAILALYTLPKPVLARIHGHAVAGGCVLSLTADWRVLREGAMIGLNEVPVGVPLPYGVTMILRESVPAPRIEEVALFGRNYEGAEAVGSGLAHEVRPPEAFDAHCLRRLEALAAKEPRAFAATKRYLRSPVAERIRAHERALAHEFLESWFSPATRRRLETIAAELRK